MMKNILIAGIVLILLVGFVFAQGGFNLPREFTINPNFAGLPTPQENQRIFGCKYEFPIKLRDVKVYDYWVQGQNLNINASFSLYTANKQSACNVKEKIITINLGSWQNSLSNYITTTSSENIRTFNNTRNNPLSTGRGE